MSWILYSKEKTLRAQHSSTNYKKYASITKAYAFDFRLKYHFILIQYISIFSKLGINVLIIINNEWNIMEMLFV